MTQETVQTYNVKIKFDESSKKLLDMQRRMASFNKTQEASLKRQISLRRQLANITASTKTQGPMGATAGASSGARASAASAAEREAKALQRATESLKNSAFWQKKQAGEAHNLARARIRERMSTAKTAQELRRIVAQEKSRLELTQRQTREMKKQTFLMEKLKVSSKQFLGNWVSFFAIAAGASAITRIGQDFEAVRNTMKAVSSDLKESGENFGFVRDEAFRLGLGLKESAKGFAKMVAARGNMSLDDTKALFTGVSEMGTLLGLSSVEAGRSINAVMQMMSKGVVSAEELKVINRFSF